jgi:hypothetical protein
MRAFFVLCLLLLMPAAAHADSEARFGTNWIRVTALPCTDPVVLVVLAAIDEDVADWRQASSFIDGAPYGACWQPDFNARVAVVLFSDRTYTTFALAHLKPVKGT